jgi:hypothetical protein
MSCHKTDIAPPSGSGVRNTSSQNPSQIRTWNLGILIAARFSTGLRSSTDTQPIRATDPEPGSKECRSGSTKLKKDKKRARNFVSSAFFFLRSLPSKQSRPAAKNKRTKWCRNCSH